MDWIQIPFTKKLSSYEQEYLSSIGLGMDRQLELISDWLGSDEFAELQRMNRNQIDAFFRNSGIRDKFDELITYNANDSHQFIENFYKMGANLGYEDINQVLAYTLADEKALYYVSQYNFELIRNLNENLREGIRETIFNGVAAGDGYNTIKNNLLELPLTPLDGISLRTRAEMIARTEYARAVNTGTLQAYANYGVDQVEIITAGDAYVCDDCLAIEDGNPYNLMDAMSLLPVHPNCRCGYAAYIPEPDDLSGYDLGSLSVVDNPLVVNLCPAVV